MIKKAKNIILLFIVIIFTQILPAQNKNVDSLLFEAVKTNNFEQVKELVEKGVNVNAKDTDNANILMWASYKGDLQLVKFLVDNRADYKYKAGVIFTDPQSYYGNLIGIAAGENKLELLKYFIEELNIDIEDIEYNPETKKADGWNALQWAANKGHIKIAEYLLEKGANINANPGNSGSTALMYAISSENEDLAELLIKKGADVNKMNKEFIAPLYYAKNKRIIELLIKNNALIYLTGNVLEYVDSIPPIYIAKQVFNAIKTNNIIYLKELINKGADLKIKNKDGYTPLFLAENFDIVKLLIENGTDVNARCSEMTSFYNYFQGYTPLHYFADNYNITKLLIKNGANINVKVSEINKYNPGYTSLHIAAENNNLSIALLLLDNKIDTTIKNNAGLKAIDIARNYGSNDVYFFLKDPEKYRIFALYQAKQYQEIFNLLKNNKTLINLKNPAGNTLLHLCIKDNNLKVLTKLLKYKPNLNIKNNLGETALLKALFLGRLEMAKLLIETGADVNIADNDSYTPLYIAEIKKHIKTKALLIHKGAAKKNIKPKLILPIAHTGCVTSVSFSPDGKSFISGSDDITIKLWDIATRKEIKTFKGNIGYVNSVCFSPDGKSFISGSDEGEIKLWDIVTGKEIKTFEKHTDGITSVSFSSDGKSFISCSYDNTIKLWDIKGKVIKSFRGHKSWVKSVSFSPDSKTFISGSGDNTIKLWDIGTGKEIKTFKGHTNDVTSVCFSPDGKSFISGSDDNTIKLWDIATGKEIKTFEGHTDDVTSVCFSPHGETFISGSGDNMIKLWDVVIGKEIKTFKGHTNDVTSVCFSPHGKSFISCSDDQTIKLWNIVTGKEIKAFEGNTDGVNSISFSPDSKSFISGSSDNTIKLWGITTGKEIKTFEGHTDGVTSVSFSPDGKSFISCSYDNTIKLWDIEGKIIKSFRGQKSWVKSVSFSPDGKTFISGSWDNTIKLWDIDSGKEIKTFKGHTMEVTSVCFSPNGKSFISSSGIDLIKLWDISTGKETKSFEGHTDYVYSVSFSPDGKSFISGSYDSTIKLWDIDSGKEIKTFMGHKGWVKSVSFSPDGKTFISGSGDETIKLWNIETGKEIKTFEGHTGGVNSVSFSFDGKFFISSSYDNTIKLWNVETGIEICSFISIDNTDWIITTPEGLFDASSGAMDKMHYVLGTEIIELSQLKDRYYEPGLLKKILNDEKLRDVQEFNDIELPPHIELSPVMIAGANGRGAKPITGDEENLSGAFFTAKITNNFSGGIGKVKIYVNGKEIIEDARLFSDLYSKEDDLKIIQNKDSIQITISLDVYSRYFLPNEENIISVKAYNGENYIISRPEVIKYTSSKKDKKEIQIPDVYILSIGTSEFYNSDINLRFAAKDAKDIATGLQIAANRLFGKEKVHTYLFTSPLSKDENMNNEEVSINTINTVFKSIAAEVSADDIVIVYLAGHGMNINTQGDGGDFYYLTEDAHSTQVSAYSDPAIREKELLSSNDLITILNKLPANKQVLIIDACHSGKAVENLMVKRDMSSSTIRALDRMRDRTGMHIITGSTADAVSYESSRYGQGILTYSLLEGLKGASLKEDKFVDVMKWFQTAKERVPVLASDFGGIQEPVVFSPYVEGKYDKGAESFEIGELNNEDKKLVPLAKSKPVFVFSSFQNIETFDDNLELGEKSDNHFRELTSKGKKAPLILLETRNFPDAYKIRGQYTVNDDNINLTVKLFNGKKAVKTIELKSPKENIPKLINDLTDKILLFISK